MHDQIVDLCLPPPPRGGCPSSPLVQEPNTAWCSGQVCGEWSWVSTRFALEEYIESHCHTMLPYINEFEPIPLPPYPTY